MSARHEKQNNRTLRRSILVVLAMFAFGFALIPLYNIVCKALKIGGYTEQVSQTKADEVKIDKSRKIKVKFVSHVNSGLPWDFYPTVGHVYVHPGEHKKVEYVVKNKSTNNTIGHAKFGLTPPESGRYFNKVKCFCFGHGRSNLGANQEKKMILVFYVSPKISKRINEITLTYTFMDASAYASK